VKIKKKELENGDIALVVDATIEEVDGFYDAAVTQIALQSGIDPFHVDDLEKAVRGVVDDAFFESFAANQVMASLAPFAVSSERLDILMEPKVYPLGDECARGKPLAFKVEVTPKPHYELSSYGPVTITVPSTEITEAEIDEQLASMAESFAEYEPVEGADAKDANGEQRFEKAVPKITDAWIAEKASNIGTLERFRQLLREEGEARKKRELGNIKSLLAVTELAKRFEGAIPDELFMYTYRDMMNDLEAGLQKNGSTLKQYIEQQGEDEKSFQMQMMMQAREVMTQGLSLDALARHKGFVVEDADLEAVYELMAPGHASEVREQYEKTGKMYFIRENALRNKTNRWLVETAEVTIARS
jgi:FKBP-type peptidyl-prolyl cis-trans isomerase (trigger factor)